MLHLINDKPYLSFEKFENYTLDFAKLLRQAQDYLMFSDDWHYSVGWALGQDLWGDKSVDKSLIQNIVRMEDLKYTEEDLARRAKLKSFKERMAYDAVVKGVYTPWMVYDLNGIGEWTKRKDKRTRWSADVMKYMPFLPQMISEIPIIEHVGWARIYANAAFNFTPPHQDYSDNIPVDEFLYFNLAGKPTYIAESVAGKRVYLDQKCVYFDAANWHGTDPEPRFNFAIRVDCKFTPKFSETLRYSRESARAALRMVDSHAG